MWLSRRLWWREAESLNFFLAVMHVCFVVVVIIVIIIIIIIIINFIAHQV